MHKSVSQVLEPKVPIEKGAVVDGVEEPVIAKAGDNLRIKVTDGFDPSGTEPKSYDVIGDPAVLPRYQVSTVLMRIADAGDTVARRAAAETPQRAAATVIIVRTLIQPSCSRLDGGESRKALPLPAPSTVRIQVRLLSITSALTQSPTPRMHFGLFRGPRIGAVSVKFG